MIEAGSGQTPVQLPGVCSVQYVPKRVSEAQTNSVLHC
jgi:hypothetical protein